MDSDEVLPEDEEFDSFNDPELEPEEYSEIAAVVDVSIYGEDRIFRPIQINQDDQLINLTPDDAKRLLDFLTVAVKFVDEYQNKIIQ